MQVQSPHSRSRLKDKLIPQKILMRKGLEGSNIDTKEEGPGRDAMDTKEERPGRDAMDTEDGTRMGCHGFQRNAWRGCRTHRRRPWRRCHAHRKGLEVIICTRKDSLSSSEEKHSEDSTSQITTGIHIHSNIRQLPRKIATPTFPNTLEKKVISSTLYLFSPSNSRYGSLLAFRVPLIPSSALES